MALQPIPSSIDRLLISIHPFSIDLAISHPAQPISGVCRSVSIDVLCKLGDSLNNIVIDIDVKIELPILVRRRLSYLLGRGRRAVGCVPRNLDQEEGSESPDEAVRFLKGDAWSVRPFGEGLQSRACMLMAPAAHSDFRCRIFSFIDL